MKLKTKFLIAKKIWMLFVLFWTTETVYFLFVDGWHYNPISYSEVICDRISSVIAIVSIAFFVSVLYEIIELFATAYRIDVFLKNNKDDQSNQDNP